MPMQSFGQAPPLAAVLSLLVVCVPALAGDQPQWGERHSRNMVSEETGLPDRFDPETGENVKWSVPIGSQCWSTPVVAEGKVLIGTNNGQPRDPKHEGDRGVMMCFDEADGSFQWQLVVPKLEGDVYLDWPRVGMCSPATVEGGRVYTVTNRDEVVCLDLDGMADGNDGPFGDEGRHMAPEDEPPMEPGPLDADVLWLLDLRAAAGVRPHDAAHSSILLDGPYLYVNTSNGLNSKHTGVEKPEAPSLVAVDKATGQLVARDREPIGPRIFHSTWSSPALGEVSGRRLVFFAGGDGVVYAFRALRDPKSETRNPKEIRSSDIEGSKESYRTDRISDFGFRVSSLAALDSPPSRVGQAQRGPTDENLPRSWWAGAALVPPYETPAALELVWRFDCDPTAPKEDVHSYIRNRETSPSNIKSMPVYCDGRVYVTVGGDIWWGKNEAWLKCIDAGGEGDVTSSGLLWSYPLERHCCSTPSIHDGLVYVADCGGKVHCVDAETGRPCWVHDAEGEIWASTLVADGKLYVGTRRGDFWVLAAGRRLEVLSSIRLDEPVISTPIAAGGTLYVCTMSQLYALQRAR